MYNLALSPAHEAFLAATFAANRARYAGWRMETEPGGPPSDEPNNNPEAEPGGAPTPKDLDKGYPPNTPVVEMTTEQQAAYYKQQAAKHESRNKALLAITGGKVGDALKSDLEELAALRESTLTDTEKALSDATKAGEAAATLKYGTMLVEAEFRAQLATVEPERRDAILDNLKAAFSNYLTDDGLPDTAKVQALVAAINVPDKGNPRPLDFGSGHKRHRDQTPVNGIQAGADMFTASRGRTSN